MLGFTESQRIKKINLLPLVGEKGLFIFDQICMHGADDTDVILVRHDLHV